MNREIKFRGKRKDNGEWVEGDLIHDVDGWVGIRKWPKEREWGERLLYEVDPATVGQFIGFKDKNDKEGYFSDLLQDKDGNIYQVCWIEVAARFELVNVKDLTIHLSPEAISFMEIIGNIFDNPELLKTAGAGKG